MYRCTRVILPNDVSFSANRVAREVCFFIFFQVLDSRLYPFLIPNGPGYTRFRFMPFLLCISSMKYMFFIMYSGVWYISVLCILRPSFLFVSHSPKSGASCFLVGHIPSCRHRLSIVPNITSPVSQPFIVASAVFAVPARRRCFRMVDSTLWHCAFLEGLVVREGGVCCG